MKTIPLTQGKIAIVDDCDFDQLSKYKWYAQKNGDNWYAGRRERKSGKCKLLWMHREILKTPQGMDTDHIDHNGLNNRNYNLRIATRAQNMSNGRKRKGTSKYKGVSWDRSSCKWRASIGLDWRDIYLGLFCSEIKAALAYDKAAHKYFGEFASSNFQMGQPKRE